MTTNNQYQHKKKGYGFIDYENYASAEAASLAMDEFDLGGKPLCVCKAICGAGINSLGVSLGIGSTVPMYDSTQNATQMNSNSQINSNQNSNPPTLPPSLAHNVTAVSKFSFFFFFFFFSF